MASNISAGSSEQFVEQRLIAGLLTGSMLQHKELLDMLEDVNVRGMRQKTLLHVGVGLGKADWVEELLARGADPDLVDDTRLNALASADEMVRQFPEDVERSNVLKLVTMVHRRDRVILRRVESSLSRSTDHVTTVASPGCDIASLESSVASLRQEMKGLVRHLSSSLEELKAQVCGRDALLRCLEEAVTSTVEDVTSIKFGLGGEGAVSLTTSDPAKARQECVEGMLRRTRIVYGDGVDRMRSYYERLYDEGDCTACIIKYLSGDDRVKVMVDLDSMNIGRMKEKVVLLDETQRNGSDLRSFCDFESETVYLGAKDSEKLVDARLAWALSQLSLKLAFGNEGKPYRKGDAEGVRDWMRAMEEAEERGLGLHGRISYALDQRVQCARECLLAAAVPPIIIYNGSTEGRVYLQQHHPLLFSLYTNNVMGTLLAKARR